MQHCPCRGGASPSVAGIPRLQAGEDVKNDPQPSWILEGRTIHFMGRMVCLQEAVDKDTCGLEPASLAGAIKNAICRCANLLDNWLAAEDPRARASHNANAAYRLLLDDFRSRPDTERT